MHHVFIQDLLRQSEKTEEDLAKKLESVMKSRVSNGPSDVNDVKSSKTGCWCFWMPDRFMLTLIFIHSTIHGWVNACFGDLFIPVECVECCDWKFRGPVNNDFVTHWKWGYPMGSLALGWLRYPSYKLDICDRRVIRTRATRVGMSGWPGQCPGILAIKYRQVEGHLLMTVCVD